MSTKTLLRKYIVNLVQEMATRYKKETGENLPRWQQKFREYERAGGYLVHFGFHPKLGLNPLNEFQTTPTGVYFYQLNTKTMQKFGIDRPYAMIAKIKDGARILDLESYSDADLSRDIGILKRKYSGKADLTDETVKAWEDQGPAKTLWETIKALSMDIVGDSRGPDALLKYRKDNMAWVDPTNPKSSEKTRKRRSARIHTNTAKLHAKADKNFNYRDYVGRDKEHFSFDEEVSDLENPGKTKIKKNPILRHLPDNTSHDETIDTENRKDAPVNFSVTQMTKILQGDLGYDGARDGLNSPGRGIIHGNEPTQIVMFNIGAVNHVDTIRKPTDVKEVEELTKEHHNEKDFSGQDLTGRDKMFRDTRFIGSNFSKSNLSGISIAGCNLSRTNCSGANLSDTSIYNVKFNNSGLQSTNFVSSRIHNVTFNGSNMTKTNLSRIEGRELEFTNVNMAGLNLSQAKVEQSWFYQAQVHGTNMSRTVFEDCFFGETDFKNADLTETRFLNCDFEGASFEKNGGYHMGTMGLATFKNCSNLPPDIRLDDNGKVISEQKQRTQ